MRRLIIDENTIYELDENCMLTREVSDKKEKKELNKDKKSDKTKNR